MPERIHYNARKLGRELILESEETSKHETFGENKLKTNILVILTHCLFKNIFG